MTTEQAIQIAIKSGYKLRHKHADEKAHYADTFLDVNFWKYLGIGMNWGKEICHSCFATRMTRAFTNACWCTNMDTNTPDKQNWMEGWRHYWLLFINQRANGKTPDDFFEFFLK